jgi:hypothetical protein
MLVENKFIFLNIPRCASTSFHLTCVKNHLDLRFADDSVLGLVKKRNDDDIVHIHETINSLEERFGTDIPVISIRRNQYERFLSMWKHIINEAIDIGDKNLVDTFTKMEISDILYYSLNDILTSKMRHHLIKGFLSRKGLVFENTDQKIIALLNNLFIHESYYHNNNDRVIWFNINELDKLEEWVSNMLEIDFNMLHLNSSKSVKVGVEIDGEFIDLYDNIYKTLDNPKKTSSLL